MSLLESDPQSGGYHAAFGAAGLAIEIQRVAGVHVAHYKEGANDPSSPRGKDDRDDARD